MSYITWRSGGVSHLFTFCGRTTPLIGSDSMSRCVTSIVLILQNHCTQSTSINSVSLWQCGARWHERHRIDMYRYSQES